MSNTNTSGWHVCAIIATRMLCVLVVALLVALALPCVSPFAADSGSAHAMTLEEASKKVEETSAVYNTAVKKRDSIKSDISRLDKKISRLEAKMPAIREKASSAMVSMYKESNMKLAVIEAVLGTRSLEDAIYCYDLCNRLLTEQTDRLQELSDATNELEKSKADLKKDKKEAQAAVKEAKFALDEAKAARTQAQAEALAAKGGALAAQIDWSMDREEFVKHWGKRINRYLSGTALAGQGENFADAAYENGADPRWSVAISRIESGCGAACFRPYNAWGWMGASFSSWSEGIYKHVKYLAGPLYGGYLTLHGARTYCPPTYQDWYSKVANEMSKM